MRLATIILTLLALFLINAHSLRVGEEERRIWAPLVLVIMTGVAALRFPRLLRINTAVLTSPPVLLYAAYLAWLCMCQLWSVGAAEGRSHILVLAVTMLVALSLADEHPARIARAYLVAVCGILVVSWLGAGAGAEFVARPGGVWRLKGLMMHEQVMLLVCIAAALLALVRTLNRRRCGEPDPMWPNMLFAGLLLATMAATKGRSLTIFFLLACFIVLFFHVRGPSRLWLLLGGVLACGSLWVLVDIILPLVSRGQEESLSGRVIVWELTWDEIVRRPWLGYGFGTYQDYFFTIWNNWAPGHAHNIFLQVWFESGLVGLVLFALFLLAVIAQGFRFQRRSGLLSYSMHLAIFALLGGTMSVFVGEKLGTLYGLLLVLALSERHLATVVEGMSRSAPAEPPPVEVLAITGATPNSAGLAR